MGAMSTNFHPFHMHLYHMQIATPGGCGAHEEGEFYDTISPLQAIVLFASGLPTLDSVVCCIATFSFTKTMDPCLG